MSNRAVPCRIACRASNASGTARVGNPGGLAVGHHITKLTPPRSLRAMRGGIGAGEGAGSGRGR
jgi:hypothetical protein